MNLWNLVPIKKNWQLHLITFYKKQLGTSRAKQKKKKQVGVATCIYFVW